jgi:hypothetical protein
VGHDPIPPVRAPDQMSGPLAEQPVVAIPKAPAVDGGGVGNFADLDAAIEVSIGKTLLDLLKPGEIVSGRVIQHLEHDSYAFTIRGRTVVADSAVPLLPDSVVQFEVLPPSGDEQLRLRALTTLPQPGAPTANAAARLAQLGLPDSPEAMTVLRAFEQAEAPMNSERMTAALHALRGQPAQQAAPEETAAVHAALAKAGMPVTPATTALAQRSVESQLPNLAQALGELKQLARTWPDARTATSPRAPAPSATASAPLLPELRTANTGIPAATPLSFKEAMQSLVALAIPDVGHEGAPAVAKALALIGIVPSDTQANSAPTSSTPTKLANAADRQPAIPGAPAHDSADRAAHREIRARDVERSGVDERILPRLAPLAATAGDSEAPALRHVMRELHGETVFKPNRLTDYDVVVGLPLQDRGLPTPARLAVSKREAGGITATYVRVDAELSRLGPVSVRMSGSDNSAIAITVLVTPPARSAVDAAAPLMERALADLGIVAQLRVAELDAADFGSAS